MQSVNSEALRLATDLEQIESLLHFLRGTTIEELRVGFAADMRKVYEEKMAEVEATINHLIQKKK